MPHGLRSTFRDLAHITTNYPRELAEIQLAHVGGTEAERAYRRANALEKRRENVRNADGTFGTGNLGKLKGTHHKATRTAMAPEGDGTALRPCLERIAPPQRDAPVIFDQPRMETASDAATAVGAVLGAMALGELTPTEGVHIIQFVETCRRTLETCELETRVVLPSVPISVRHSTG